MSFWEKIKSCFKQPSQNSTADIGSSTDEVIDRLSEELTTDTNDSDD